MSVYANSRSILHKGDGLTQIAITPDVCKTPTPGGPVPIPYPNFAMDANLAKASKKVKIKGNKIALKSSNLSTSTGDEPGTLKGIISNKWKGKCTWPVVSMDVKVEGKGVARFMDMTLHNGNMSNDNGLNGGTPSAAPPQVDLTKCLHCGQPLDSHPPLATNNKSLMKKVNDKTLNPKPQSAKTVGGISTNGQTYYAHSASTPVTPHNLSTNQPLRISPAERRAIESLPKGNSIGNCAEQKLLDTAFTQKGNPYPAGDIKMAIGESEHGRPDKKRLKNTKYKPPCDTCKILMPAMLCTNPPK